jgi:GH24 family phage-related lysozyme (muramidase)
MDKRYIVEVRSKLLPKIATVASIGAAAFGAPILGAKVAGVGRFAPQNQPSPIQPTSVSTPTPVQTTQNIPSNVEDKNQNTGKIKPVVKSNNFDHSETIEFIKSHEGFKPKAYWDVKQWSVGHGSGIHTDGNKVTKDTVVTPEQAHDMLVHHVNQRIMPKVKNLSIWQNMNDRQRGGFVSFLYNVGEHVVGSKNHPTINAAIHSNDVNKLYGAMGKYHKITDSKGNKIVSKGLLKRRSDEKKWAFEVNHETKK